MLLDCPSCATSYDEDPARLLPGGRPVRCPRCYAAWHLEILFDTNAGSDDAPRKALLTTTACVAGLSVHANRTAGPRVASLDAFELIREQAHDALNAIRLRYREDHKRIVSRQGVRAAIPPPHAGESPAEAATPPVQPRLPGTGRDANTRMRISRAFADALADAPNEIAWSNNEQPRTGNEAGSFAVVVDDEQPADGGTSAAAVEGTKEGERIVSAADKQYTDSVAALAASSANEPGGELEELPTPADFEVKGLSTAPWQVDDPDLKAAPAPLCEDGGTVPLTERKRPLSKEQECKIAGWRTRQKREHNDLLDRLVETRQREELIREARKAAQRAIRESGPEPRAAGDGWRNMWIALIMTSAILLFLRLWF